MVQIKEYRILLPLNVADYQIAQLYTTIQISKQETVDGSGVEILENKPYMDSANSTNSGQYTKKTYHLGNRLPKLIAKCVPNNALKLIEDAWNSYPYCKTVIKNDYLGDKFDLTIKTMHIEDNGQRYNVHNLTDDQLKLREIITIDLTNKSDSLVMCCYKLVMLTCNVRFIHSLIEDQVMNYQYNMFVNFHQQLLQYKEKWINYSLIEIRQLEEDTKNELNKLLINHSA